MWLILILLFYVVNSYEVIRSPIVYDDDSLIYTSRETEERPYTRSVKYHYYTDFKALNRTFKLWLNPVNVIDGVNCTYEGQDEDISDSAVIVNKCHGFFSGVVKHPNETYYFSPMYNNHSVVVSTQNESLGTTGDCGTEHNISDISDIALETADLPQQGQMMYVNLVLVTDKARYQFLNKDVRALEASTVNIATQIKFIYEQFLSPYYRIVIQIKGIYHLKDTASDWDGFSESTNILNSFNYWALKQPWNAPYTAAHLLTALDFEGSIIGRAYMATACLYNGVTAGVIQTTNPYDVMNAKITAHELGHNLGMRHTNTYMVGTPLDTPEKINACLNQISSVMSSIIHGSSFSWDVCSEEWFRLFIEGYPYRCSYSRCTYQKGVAGTCMESKSPMCGNTVIDDDEECDCGPAGFCKDPCCDPTTCKLKGVCSPYMHDCCTNDCKLSKNNVCHEATHPTCDSDVKCSGLSRTCPVVTRIHGQLCNKNTKSGRCYGGDCVSTAISCSLVPTEYTPRNGIDGPCPRALEGDLACKKLYCKQKTSDYCDLYYAPNILMVKNGSPCGANDICIDESCVQLNTTKETSHPTDEPTVTPTDQPTIKPSIRPTRRCKKRITKKVKRMFRSS